MGRSQHKGFTLIELLVVTAVFAMVFLIATTVYSRIFVQQQKASSSQQVTADGRFILETMARSIRQGTVDYTYYRTATPALPRPQQILVLRNAVNGQLCYGLTNGKIQFSTDCTTWQDITPTTLQVTEFWVYIRPGSDPFAGIPASQADCPATTTYSNGTCVCPTLAGFPNVGDSSQCFAGQTCAQIDTEVPTSPFICKNANIQPAVTIYLTTKPTNNRDTDTTAKTLQTTVTSRVYKR